MIIMSKFTETRLWKLEAISDKISYKDFRKSMSKRTYYNFLANVKSKKVVNSKQFKAGNRILNSKFKRYVKDTLYIIHRETSGIILSFIRGINYELNQDEYVFTEVAKSQKKKIEKLIEYYKAQDQELYPNKILMIGDLSNYL